MYMQWVLKSPAAPLVTLHMCLFVNVFIHRSLSITVYFISFSVVQMLITLLESTDREVVFCACGVLINLMVENENRIILKDEGGVRKYVSFPKSMSYYMASENLCEEKN